MENVAGNSMFVTAAALQGSEINSAEMQLPGIEPKQAGEVFSGKYLPPTSSDIRGTIQIVQPSGDHLADFAIALIWPVLIGLLVILFKKQIRAFLDVMIDRVKAGASIKAGPLEIGSVEVQTTAQQAARLETEVKQTAESEQTSESSATPESVETQPETASIEAPKNEELKSAYVVAEDLALREIQAEFNAPLVRNVSITGEQFDGFLAADQQHLIEVKFFRLPAKIKTADRMAAKFGASLFRLGARSVRGILAIVFDTDVDIAHERQKFVSAAARNSSIPIDVRIYLFADLRTKYGFDDAKFRRSEDE